MAVKADHWIQKMSQEKGLIEPFVDRQVRDGVISYGLSSYGYDMRLADEFKIPDTSHGAGQSIIDPKQSGSVKFTDFKGDSIVLQPGQFVLGRSVEYFRIPRDILTIAYGKSTYARSGVFCNITPFEPEWEGFVTLMIANCGPLPVRVYANEGIAQVIFLQSNEPCAVSYADKKGKYQSQQTITQSRL